MNRCHPLPLLGRARRGLWSAVPLLCAALCAVPAQAELTEWLYRPFGQSDDFGLPNNWLMPNGLRAIDPPNASIRGVLDGGHSPKLDGQITFGSFKAPSAGARELSGSDGTFEFGKPVLRLGNDQNEAALMIGAPTEDGYGGADMRFSSFRLVSAGNALIHQSSKLHIVDVAWSHDGDLVVGASPEFGSTRALLIVGFGSTLTPGLGTLNAIIGSAVEAHLLVKDTASLEATTLAVGANVSGTFSLMQVEAGGTTRVLQNLQVGRDGDGRIQLGGSSGGGLWAGARLIAETASLGLAGGGLGELLMGPGAQAEFNRLNIGVAPFGATGLANGRLEIFADTPGSREPAGLVRVNELAIGDGGNGSVLAYGNLEVRSRLGLGRALSGDSGGGSSSLVSHGSTVVGDPTRSFSGRVEMGAGSTWINHGQAEVFGNVDLGTYGGRVNLSAAAGSTMLVHGGVSAGDYHLFGAAPIDVRVVVEPGARLQTQTLVLYRNAELSGGGEVVGNVQVLGGTVAPGMSPGWLTIDGNLSLGNGTLVIELGGLIAGSQYDVLGVLGTLDLGTGSTLELGAVNGFAPQADQGFAFLRAGTLNGSFSTLVDHTGLNLTLADLQSANGVFGINLAAAVPEPDSRALLVVGLVGVGMLLRRRRLRRSA